MKNSKILITCLLLLFSMSCDDNDYPSQITQTENTFELTLTKSLEGGTVDYADFNYIDQTVITASLKVCDSDGNNCTSQNLPENNRNVNFYWSLSPEQIGAGSYLSYDNGQSSVFQNGNATIPSVGFLNLVWMDEGIQAENISLSAEYVDILGNSYLSDTLNFQIRSIYETVSDLSELEYIIDEIIYDTENLSREGTIGAIVKNSNSSIIQGVDVIISPPNNISPSEQDVYNLISFSDPDNTVTTDETGRAEFDFTLLVNQNLIDNISDNNETIEIEYDVYVENENLIQAEEGGLCNVDFNNNGICEIKTSATLTLTTEVFSIASSLGDIVMTVSPESFTLDSNDPNLYNIEIYAEALTPDGGVLIPPDERTIEFNFSRTPEIGSISGATVNSSDGTASATLSGYFAQNAGTSIEITGSIIEDGQSLQSVANTVELNSQEAELVAETDVFNLQISPSTVYAETSDTTFNFNLTAYVLDENGGGIENLNIQFNNESESLDGMTFDSQVAITNSSGQASTILNVSGQNNVEIKISAEILAPINVCCDTVDPLTDECTDESNNICESDLVLAQITNDFEEALSSLVDNGGSLTVEMTPNLLLFNDIPGSASESDDTTSTEADQTEDQISIQAIAKDQFGGGITGLPVQFDIGSDSYGILSFSEVVSGSDGIALNAINNITPQENVIDSIMLSTSINGSNVTDDAKTYIAYQSVYNTSLVENLDAVFLQNFSVVNNININYEDSVLAQVLDINNVPVADVPINFQLFTEDIGYLANSVVWTDSLGIAGTKFVITQADMNEDQDIVDIDIQVTVGGFTELLERTYVIQGSPNIEDDVAEFHYYPLNPDTITLYTGSGNAASIQLPFIAKDINGVRIEGVPVQFELFESGFRTNGSLNSSLEFTCCSADSAASDSLFDFNGDGVSSQDENMGIASVVYENAIPGSFDKIRAYITDPANQNDNLFIDEITIVTKAAEEQVNSLYTFAIPQTIYMTDNDSVYCDTTYAIARDSYGQSLKDIPVRFSLDAQDFDYGYISANNTVTDTLTIGSALQIIGAKTVFCTWPNVEIEEDTVIVNIEASIINNDSVDPSNVDIYLIEDLPDCPDCQASLSLSSEYYELPAGDNDIFTTSITATVIDSTENPVPEFSLVEFQSFTEDANGDLVPIGNIEPYKYTDSNGQATATFNIGNDVGLASIVGFAPQFNLADTIYVSLYSTSASSMEIVQPFPNEITVQGGGGIESTELNVNVKDGNGNLVSEPFLVKFEIQSNAPNGVYLNELDDNNFIECVESSNGIATVTLNSGSQPGSVPIRVELYDIQTLADAGVSCSNISSSTFSNYGITDAEAIPVTVVTGPPEFGQINYSYVDINPIGGGLYEVPLSVNLWDFYSNPVADSTNVYIWVEGVGDIWSSDSTYVEGDTVKYGQLDINGNPIIIDSLLYVCTQDQLFSGVPPFNPLSNFAQVPHPGSIEGEAKTGMLAPDNNSYPGVAWSRIIYGTSDIFASTVVKALTYDSDGNKLVIDSRESHNNENLVLPFQPGALTVGSSVQFWDFSVFGDVGINDLDDTVAVNIQANLQDFYQYPVADGDVLINAPGANVWSVCDPGDTDGDGYVGECWEDTNGSGALEIPPSFAADTQNDDLGLTCSICTSNGGFWNYDDSDTGSFNANDGDGVPDDDPSYGRTNGSGQIVWLISYSEALNTGDGGDPETYNDFTSTVTLQLLDPLQTTSDGIDILLIKSEQNEN